MKTDRHSGSEMKDFVITNRTLVAAGLAEEFFV